MNNNIDTILVVDDEELNLELIEEYLSTEGYKCECVTRGREAIERLNKNHNKYSCVLLDRMMPEMDGIEVLNIIKADSNYSRLPIIMQTAITGKESLQEGLEAGAYYYLTKPYNARTLLAIVRAAVTDYQQVISLQHSLAETTYSLQMMQQGRFNFKTIEQARSLSVLLAKACNHADNVVLGLSELFINAIEHGNLGISYKDKTKLIETGCWESEIEHLLSIDPYRDRKVSVEFNRTKNQQAFTIIDQGEGFSWKEYMEISPERALNSHGRGIAMAKTISFDSIEYCGKGNEVYVTVLS